MFTIAICYLIHLTNFAQAPGTITTVEGVYGGKINAIVGAQVGGVLSDTFRVIVATESANSIFYGTGTFPSLGAVSMGSFTALPSANANTGFGSAINKLAYHKKSEAIFFIANSNVYATTITAAAATKLTTSNDYVDIAIKTNGFYALRTVGSNNTIEYSTIDVTTGALTSVSSTNIVGQSYSNIVIGKDDKLYLFRSSTDPQAVQFGSTFSAGINFAATTVDAIGLSAAYSWNAMSVYTDGTVFVGGTNGGTNPYKYVGTTATFGTAYTTIATGIAGTSGSNIEFRDGLVGNYYVYFGSAYSNAKGAAASWSNFGNSSYETHPNDGYVRFFNENSATGGIVLLTTDAGLGMTKNSGSAIKDINDGILATQVQDFDMNSSKTFGWLAAKDGIRYVHDYGTASKAWTTAFWPLGDGSPYYSAEMVGNDVKSAYVGNVRIYKTVDTGANWTKVFTPENAPYNFPQVGVRAEAIAVSDSLNNIVMAGFYNQNAGQYGGVFYSVDGGTNWSQLLISAAAVGQDVNVNDIELTTDSGKIVAYIGVEYINSTVRGMYKAQYDGTSWTVRREEIYGASSSKFSITDIVIHSKDTIAAVGSFYNPTLLSSYPIYFTISRPVYNSWTSTVVDVTRQNAYTACAWNKDTIFYAYNENIYYDIISFNATSTSRVGEATYSTVDIGTQINVMYYDELLVGSTTGFRSMRGAKTIYTAPIIPTINISANKNNICPNTNVTFTAMVTNATLPVFFTWKINGNVVGPNAASFTTNALLNNAIVTCSINTTSGTFTSNSITIIVAGFPFVNAITGTTKSCTIGSNSQLNNATIGGVWSSTNTMVATVSATGKVTSIGNGNTNINYTVTNASGCSNMMSVIFNVAPQPLPQSTSGANSVCVGSSITLTNTTFIPTGGSGVFTSTAGRATVNNAGLVTGTSAGNATIKYTVTNGLGCSNSIDKTIVVNAIPAMPTMAYASGYSNPTGAGGYCKNKTFGVVGSPINGVWNSSNPAIFSITNVGVINTLAIGTSTLSYTIADANGCSNSRTKNLTVVNCASRGTMANSELQATTVFTMFPNPARSVVSLLVDKLIGAGSVAITDLYGKQIKIQALSLGKNNLDISNLSKGMYVVTVQINNQSQTQKLIVE